MNQLYRRIPHPNQIPTSLSVISFSSFQYGVKALRSLLLYLTDSPDSPKRMNHLVVAASLFERVSCLIYRGKDGQYRKPPEQKYKKELFESFAETQEEIAYNCKQQISSGEAEQFFRIIWNIADLVCPMMANINEQAFVSEYVYAIEYAIKHSGDLPKPVILSLFPNNYPDYDPYESGTLADIVRKLE